MTMTVKARPTLYKGIRMRSRLEADFARFLDNTGADWAYEPECFAGPDGQWLPDFRVTRGDYNVYFEIKPESLNEDEIDPMLERMTVTWLTEPTATLQLVIWPFGNPSGNRSIMGFPPDPDDGDCLTWWLAVGDGDPVPWPGMGQLERLLIAKCDEIEAVQSPVAEMSLSLVSRDERGITGLVSQGDALTACGISPDRLWWCDCGTQVDGASRKVRPADVCDHLRVLGHAPSPQVDAP